MTKETKQAVKAAAYAEYRECAVNGFRAMGVPDVDDSWEGIMRAVDYARDHADREGEFSGAVMLAAKWMHGYLEQDTACRVKKTTEMVEREVAALAGDAHEEAHEEAHEAPAAASPATAAK